MVFHLVPTVERHRSKISSKPNTPSPSRPEPDRISSNKPTRLFAQPGLLEAERIGEDSMRHSSVFRLCAGGMEASTSRTVTYPLELLK
jgi:hypothetical protein